MRYFLFEIWYSSSHEVSIIIGCNRFPKFTSVLDLYSKKIDEDHQKAGALGGIDFEWLNVRPIFEFKDKTDAIFFAETKIDIIEL